MKCIQKSLGNLVPNYPIENFCIPKKTLFIDIETTGLYAKSSSLYLIGCVYYHLDEANSCWHSIQWFATNYEDEENILRSFADFAKSYHYLIHFNGNQFDIPYLERKFEQYHIDFNIRNFEGIDIYKRVALCKHFLQLPNCKQTSIEKFLRLNREDKYNGGELIQVYKDYLINHSEKQEKLLLLHNKDVAVIDNL